MFLMFFFFFLCSGDTDGRVPVTSTKNSIKKMNLPIKTRWYPWLAYGEVIPKLAIYTLAF